MSSIRSIFKDYTYKITALGYDEEKAFDQAKKDISELINNKVIGEDLSLENIDPLTSPRSYEFRCVENKLKGRQRNRSKELLK